METPPQTDEKMEEPSQVTRTKDPKKVAAGKLGAAARAAKKERLLAQLEVEKKNLLSEPETPHPVPPPVPPPKPQDSWAVVGVVAVAGAVLLVMRFRSPPAPRPRQDTTRVA
jgi:hypothetical protein